MWLRAPVLRVRRLSIFVSTRKVPGMRAVGPAPYGVFEPFGPPGVVFGAGENRSGE